MTGMSSLRRAYELRRREATLLVFLAAIVAFAMWYWTGGTMGFLWFGVAACGFVLDVVFYKRYVDSPALERSDIVFLTLWAFWLAGVFSIIPWAMFAMGRWDATIAGFAILLAATLRNTSDFGTHRWIGIGSILPYVVLGLAIPFMSIDGIEDGNGTILSMIAVIAMFGYILQHSGRRESAERRAIQLARHDPLTNLMNRRAFMEEAERRFSERGAKTFALIFIDLDGFKSINDVHGHHAGDQLIVATARRLSARPDIKFVARLGGDEFAALTVDVNGSEAAMTTAHAIADLLGGTVEVDRKPLALTASIGVSLRSDDIETLAELIQTADAAMRRAKDTGGGVRLFDRALDLELRQRAVVEAEIRAGIPRGEFIPFFQPIVDLPTGQTVGWEMLMRWEHPTRGILPPAVFIEIAEETRLIDQMFWPVLDRALGATRDLPGDLLLSVNVAPDQLRDHDFSGRLVRALVAHDYPPTRLEIELTERGVVDDVDRIAAELRSLAKHGIRIALDDFGTGHSTLRLIRELPLHKLKIDRSFVKSALTDREDATIIDAILGLARAMGLTATAEGIEDQATASYLADIGCPYGQGYYFGRPSAYPDWRADRKMEPRSVTPGRSAAG